MIRDEACIEITKLLQKILEGSKTKEELALTGILALVVVSVELGMTMELMQSLAPFARVVKEVIDAKGQGQEPLLKEELEWPDEIEGKVM